ncbi:omega-amidase, chloroplastic-like isoform X2 [Hordeum vulgare subsp. vulgare]|uniref:CN hydrolase domain-containing protein n=1 Tax=Hordeum vulgare subsp. vulgare TaxID=112509 RepID=A0A8I6YT36_HORVV|nr:omega-amidase, chloroplastic-like isoform X2 [Hordeum vulgare subsp. vulgare]
MPQVAQYKVALCQLPVSPDKHGNIARARARIEAAATAGAKLVVLPEVWSCPYAMETMPSYAEDIDGGRSPSVSMLSEVAAASKITIVGGSVPEVASGQLFNTCCVVGPDGEIKAKHRKLHLFGIDIPGDINFRESDTFTAGQEPTVVDTDVGRIGIGICHDIRFPELAMLYRSRGAHLICYPSAFNMSTGQLLWDLMQKSRAVDNQLFVATCSPARDPNSQSDFVAWGHSSLIGPFGEVLAAAGHEDATVIGEIDLSLIRAVRENLPLETQGRGDLYRLIDVQRECSS